MNDLRRLIREIHRRSLWQVLGIYLAGSWVIIEVVDRLAGLMDLPEWAPRLALFLLIVGLPIVLATAFVQEGVRGPEESDAKPAVKPDAIPADRNIPISAPPAAHRLFTWRNAILGGVGAFALLGILATGWMLTARWRAGEDNVKRIAVLPFENEGATEDEYFADGVADEVRIKLAGIPGLQVTARASTSQYKDTKKPPDQIGKELEVEYLLTGTVRWAKGSAGNRVRVNPELINVANAATVWTEVIEKQLSDVFSMQTDIASKVANQLNLALGSRTHQRLAERPTGNLEAYDAYLKGEQISQSMGANDAPTLRKAQPYYQRAVELDSTFAEAWSRIARLECQIYWVNATIEGDKRAKHAAERALALAPNRAAGRLAMGEFLRIVQKDHLGAVEQFRVGISQEPNNSELLDAIASAEKALGKFDSAVVHLRQARELNPRSVATRRLLVLAYLDANQPREALTAAREAIGVAPTNLAIIQSNSHAWAVLGELDSAKTVVKAALARGVDTTALVARYALIQEQMWLLPPELLPKVTRLTPAAFDGDRSQWALKVAATWKLLGDLARSKAYADSSVMAIEGRLRNFPDDAQLHELRGRALALAGKRQEAVQEAELSLRMRETALDADTGPYVKFQVVRILIQAGELERALNQLEPLIDLPGANLSRAYLRIDPSFRPLRGNPRFEKMIAPST